jgi:hypothetical protein
MCTCKSYNLDIEGQGESVLDLPDNVDEGRENRTVCIDACIVEAIKHLWKKGYNTLSCCCGHNKTTPSVVVADGYDKQEITRIRAEISQIDNRKWDIFQWQLANVGKS